MIKSKMFLAILILVAASVACALPTPSTGVTTPVGATPGTGPAPDAGGGGAPAGVEATQHDVFAPSVETGGTPAPQGEEDAQADQNKVYAPSIQSGSGGEGDASLTGSGQMEPHVEIQASQQTVPVGQTLTVIGRAVDIETPAYTLILRDEGVQDAPPMLEVSSAGQQTPGSGTSKILELVSVQAGPDGVIFVFRGLAPGVTTLTILASGQITPQDGSAATTGGGAGEIILTVSQ